MEERIDQKHYYYMKVIACDRYGLLEGNSGSTDKNRKVK